jgi:hypothetical protein
MKNSEITYHRASTDDELLQILKIQKQNLPGSLSDTDKENEGFLTVVHTFDILKQMNVCCAHIIAKSNTKVVGYALCMHTKFADEIEVLKPMFEEINNIDTGNLNYIIMGQVCVQKKYRKKGIFRGLYDFMKKELKPVFNSIITEVNAKNTRSLSAHLSVGFDVLKTYNSNHKNWVIISLKCNV